MDNSFHCTSNRKHEVCDVYIHLLRDGKHIAAIGTRPNKARGDRGQIQNREYIEPHATCRRTAGKIASDEFLAWRLEAFGVIVCRRI